MAARWFTIGRVAVQAVRTPGCSQSTARSGAPSGAMNRPYQPSLLRLLHGSSVLLALAAWLSGLVVYTRHDGRWGRPPLTLSGDWIDIHGTIGVLLWPVALLFALYALSLGLRRLRQPANAAALLALALAVGTGRMRNNFTCWDGWGSARRPWGTWAWCWGGEGCRWRFDAQPAEQAG